MTPLLLSLISLLIPSAPQQELTIHADRPGHAIPRSLYGIFFEEINHAGDGGLYAELVRNRNFEEPSDASGAIPGWTAWTDPAILEGSYAKLSLDRTNPQSTGTGNALKLTMNGNASALNAGFWGISVRNGADYRFRFDARRDPGINPECVMWLRGKDDANLGSVTFPGLQTNWSRIEGTLRGVATATDAQLCISFTGSGSVWLDTVSMVPVDNWNSHRFGLRKDLAQLVENLHPAFLRFPGGCYVEGGDQLKDAFRWPTTIGDIAHRPGHANASWGCWSTDGLGFHEYLQWCKDLHAEPLFVVNCGMSHKEFVPLDQLQPWVQECLDAIEYANGDEDTNWGKRRIKNGHPAPFNLKYIEIGNENGSLGGFGGTPAQYTERYRVFYDAIKSTYPNITTIANTRVSAPMELVDDHYYNSPAWFWNNTSLYDKTDRNGPKVYVGEYAVTQGCGQGNLAAALAEAAFMTGLERNSDIVTMSSYAPMFVNVNDRKWNPDMIVFDGARSYGTPSYYVQQLFATNSPDTLLPIDVPEVTDFPSITRGGIGLGSWYTDAEYKDIAIQKDGNTIYTSDFARNTDGWHIGAGEWSVHQGAYRQSVRGENKFALLELPELKDATDYTITLKARKLAGDEGFLILFRAPDADNFSWWNLGGWGNREHAIEKSDQRNKFSIGPHIPGKIEPNRWYDLSISLRGPNIRCYLDGALIHDVTEKRPPSFAATAGRIDATGELIIKVVNGGQAAVDTRVKFVGAPALASTARSLVLSSDNLADENSLTSPNRIAPIILIANAAPDSITYSFSPRSLTILRILPAKQGRGLPTGDPAGSK